MRQGDSALGPEMSNIVQYWRTTVARFPHRPAAVFEGREFSYREADRLSASLAAALRDRFEVDEGDPVAIAMPNCIEFFLAYWAVIRAGAVVAAVNCRLGEEEMAHVLSDTRARALITHGRVQQQVEAGLREADSIERIVVAHPQQARSARFADLCESDSDAASARSGLEDADPPTDALAVIAYTSGTTGKPKGAMMRHCDLLFNVKNCLVAHSFRHEDVHMLALPMFHCTALYSLLPSSAYLGSTLAIAPRPDRGELLDLIESAGVTTFLGPPTLFAMLAQGGELAERDTSSLRLIAYAGSPMHPDTIRRLRECVPHVDLRNFFGLTETTSVTHVLPSEDALSHADAVGKPLPEVRAIVADEQGEEVAPGETGELCIHRDNVISGYWNQPHRLAEDFRGSWFRTGDLAHMDEDGYLYVHGREKDVIIVGGENVVAGEVEEVIAEVEGVREVAVVGVEATGIRSYLGELVKAVVVVAPDSGVGERQIKRHCMQRLASYQVPQIIEFRDSLPRNPAGKVLKRELK
ncbi:MAG: class I adenylate-forming enzyme family protein [Armatimonadota bacterium]